MNSFARRPANRLQISKVFLSLAAIALIGGAAIFFVSLKLQQHRLGELVRESERQLREVRSRNQDLQSRIASLSSRVALRQQLVTGFITLVPVQNTAIARLTPPAIATADGGLRTAANQPLLR